MRLRPARPDDPANRLTCAGGSAPDGQRTRRARLKAEQGGDIGVLGSGDLVQTLIPHDLVDEIVLVVHLLVLGSGKRLFRDGLTLKRFRLADSLAGSNGVVTLTYRPAHHEG